MGWATFGPPCYALNDVAKDLQYGNVCPRQGRHDGPMHGIDMHREVPIASFRGVNLAKLES
eukprot:11205442-Prorocentrum_lima.AAC.1